MTKQEKVRLRGVVIAQGGKPIRRPVDPYKQDADGTRKSKAVKKLERRVRCTMKFAQQEVARGTAGDAENS